MPENDLMTALLESVTKARLAEPTPLDADRTSLDDLAAEARTARRDTPHPALCGARCCATPADYADLRDEL